MNSCSRDSSCKRAGSWKEAGSAAVRGMTAEKEAEAKVAAGTLAVRRLKAGERYKPGCSMDSSGWGLVAGKETIAGSAKTATVKGLTAGKEAGQAVRQGTRKAAKL
jgi:hypothetical protein